MCAQIYKGILQEFELFLSIDFWTFAQISKGILQELNLLGGLVGWVWWRVLYVIKENLGDFEGHLYRKVDFSVKQFCKSSKNGSFQKWHRELPIRLSLRDTATFSFWGSPGSTTASVFWKVSFSVTDSLVNLQYLSKTGWLWSNWDENSIFSSLFLWS